MIRMTALHHWNAATTETSAAGTVDRLKDSGSWNPLWDGMEDYDQKWADDYMAAIIEPYESGVIPRKTVELIAIAVDAACTHMYAPGVRRHIRAALSIGVTEQEIFEVLKLSTSLGVHAMNVALPILNEEAAAARGVREA